ncbi:MAG: hypothetical protein ACYC1C_13560 [Chloroflexota bacterium]
MIRLALLTVVEVAAFAVALVYFLFRIVTNLEKIGGVGNSLLAKIRFGVRAIEKETSHLGPGVTGLNGRLITLSQQLRMVDDELAAAAGSLAERER